MPIATPLAALASALAQQTGGRDYALDLSLEAETPLGNWRGFYSAHARGGNQILTALAVSRMSWGRSAPISTPEVAVRVRGNAGDFTMLAMPTRLVQRQRSYVAVPATGAIATMLFYIDVGRSRGALAPHFAERDRRSIVPATASGNSGG